MKQELLVTHLPPDKAATAIQLVKVHRGKLEYYADRLLWWNKKINLISRSVSRETVMKHIEHSLVLSQAEAFHQAKKIIDSGTGGGLPGIPLAIIFQDKEFLLNDIVEKKLMACKNMTRDLNLQNVKTNSSSIKDVGLDADSLLISKHAFKINELFAMIKDKEWNNILLLKGANEVKTELEGIEEQLRISVFKLEDVSDSGFYKGKAMVEIQRKNHL
ncbi:MAG: RsmG family class I SAM-dependent methyltransferase [Balneolaceae bacterium]